MTIVFKKNGMSIEMKRKNCTDVAIMYSLLSTESVCVCWGGGRGREVQGGEHRSTIMSKRRDQRVITPA